MGSFLIARMKVRYSTNHYLLLTSVMISESLIQAHIACCMLTPCVKC